MKECFKRETTCLLEGEMSLNIPLLNVFVLHISLLKLHEEKICAIEEKLELSEQKLAQQAKMQPDMEEQLKARMEALTKVGNKV